MRKRRRYSRSYYTKVKPRKRRRKGRRITKFGSPRGGQRL